MKKCECAPDCPEMIPIKNKHGDPARFKHGHYWRNRKRDNMKGPNHPNWKGGRIPDGHGYILLYMPDHPNATKLGYIREHIYFMEQKLGRYLVENEVVHHINGIKDDNRIENLLLISPNKHTVLHMIGNQYSKKDHSKTICLLCGSDKTQKRKNGRPDWAKYNGGYICKLCYRHLKNPLKGKSSKPIRYCKLCNSDKTFVDKKGHSRWRIYDNGFICTKCEQRLRKNIPEKCWRIN